MSTLILSAACPERPSLQALGACLTAELARRGETDVRTIELATTKLAYCQGEFDCWVTTPGVCRAHDAEQEIARAVHDAQHLVLLDEVTFGGHGYTLKRAQDRLICLLSPFFEKRAELTHHAARYDHAANLFALGWRATPSPAEAVTWAQLADANAINMFAPRVGATVVDDTNVAAWPAEIEAMLSSTAHPGHNIHARGPLHDALLDAAHPDAIPAGTGPTRRVAFLVGSAKISGTSTSENLARALAERLRHAGASPEVWTATDFLHEGTRCHAAIRSIIESDLFVVATPLYVDALPALATHALELVAATRTAAHPSERPADRLVALVNCGFPEPEHTRTALRILRHFAARAGYVWAGALPLGGGGMVAPVRPLDEQHGPVEHIKHALDLAAPALARGEAVPTEALTTMLKAPLPDFAYRLLGDMGWRHQAHQHGLAQAELRARPLDLPG